MASVRAPPVHLMLRHVKHFVSGIFGLLCTLPPILQSHAPRHLPAFCLVVFRHTSQTVSLRVSSLKPRPANDIGDAKHTLKVLLLGCFWCCGSQFQAAQGCRRSSSAQNTHGGPSRSIFASLFRPICGETLFASPTAATRIN